MDSKFADIPSSKLLSDVLDMTPWRRNTMSSSGVMRAARSVWLVRSAFMIVTGMDAHCGMNGGKMSVRVRWA